MKQMFIVGLGGFIGSIGRYKLGGLVLHHSADWRFPLSTFDKGTGVYHNDVSVFGARHQLRAPLREHTHHDLAINEVFRTAEANESHLWTGGDWLLRGNYKGRFRGHAIHLS